MSSSHGGFNFSLTIFVTARCLPGVFQAWFPHLPLLFLFSEARIHAERKRPSSLRFTNLTLPDLRLGNTCVLSVACRPRHCLCPRGPEDDRLGIAEAHVLRTIRDRANDRAAYRRDTLQVLSRVFDRILIFLCVFAHACPNPLGRGRLSLSSAMLASVCSVPWHRMATVTTCVVTSSGIFVAVLVAVGRTNREFWAVRHYYHASSHPAA